MPSELNPDVNIKQECAVLKLPNGLEHQIRVHKGTMGDELLLDIRDLHAKTKCFTYDPGFTCTASCSSSVTYIDGEKGVCLYRGIPVHELCEKSTFLEVAYLLMTGDLPPRETIVDFLSEIKKELLIHEKLKKMFENFTMNAHPMAVMCAVIGALSAFFSELDQSNVSHRWLAAIRLVAKMPTLAALSYKTSVGEPPVWPLAHLGYSENFLHMMFATPTEPYKVNPIHAKAIDVFLILHADHEQNASTSTVRTAGSSMANPYACIAAGVASLWGPAHGGANEAVIKMFEEIACKENISIFLEKVKKKEVRLMGFGHRVYKNFDPRAQAMKKLCHQVLKDLEVVDPHLELAMELERIALNDEYFIKRKLYPNVDFYSGIVLRAIGIPTSMFTVMFAMARCVGWTSHWLEMVHEDQMRICRPRQLYVGEQTRTYIPLDKRESSTTYPETTQTRGEPGSNAGDQNRDRLNKPIQSQEPHSSGRRGSHFAQKMANREMATGSSFRKVIPDDDTRQLPTQRPGSGNGKVSQSPPPNV